MVRWQKEVRYVAASPAPPTSERLCRRRPSIVTIGRGRRQGCAVPPILTRPAFSLRFTTTTTKSAPPRPASRSCDPDPARSSARLCLKRTEGGSDEHSNRTHPGMAHGAGQHPSGDRETRDARGTPARSQADPQAQVALGRVSARRAGAVAPLSSCLTQTEPHAHHVVQGSGSTLVYRTIRPPRL